MSKIHFLSEKVKNEFSRDSISHSHQNWKDLVQYILNNEYKILERYQYQLTNEYKIEENERIYKVHNLSLFCLPISIQIESIIQYSIINTDIVIIPSLVQDQNKLSTQKRVTSKKKAAVAECLPIIPPNDSSLDSHRKFSLPPNQHSLDDLRQRIINVIRTNSYQDELFSSLTRKHHYDNHLSRLSLRSISYGFDLGTKTTHISSPPNKIELDINQHEIIRSIESLKKNT